MSAPDGPAWNPTYENPRDEWRRVFAEAFGTFFLVVGAAGSAVVGARTPRSRPG